MSEEATGGQAAGRVEVGRLVKAFGLRGELVVIPAGNDPSRFVPGASFFLEEVGGEALRLEKVRAHEETLLLRFEGISDRTAAEPLARRSLYLEVDALPALPEGEFYHFQLVGLRVTRADGSELGTIREVLELPANNLFEVTGESGTWLIPSRKEFIEWVDLEKGEMRLTDRGDLLQAQTETPEDDLRQRPRRPRPDRARANPERPNPTRRKPADQAPAEWKPDPPPSSASRS